jgi:thioredoxin-like negative regulator of GroEL
MATVAQSVSMNAHGGQARILDGNKTASVYTMLRDGKYQEAARFLLQETQSHPKSRAALALLGYCYYYMQDFQNAASTYETLVHTHTHTHTHTQTHTHTHIHTHTYTHTHTHTHR